MPEFKFSDRGAVRTLLLIPGWAADCRVFDTLNMRFNYLEPIAFSPFDFEKDIPAALEKNGLRKISILGWSMGGFMAFDLLSKHSGIIDEIIFVSVRRGYDRNNIEEIKKLLKRNKDAFLYRFYMESFSKSDRGARSWFKQNLLKDYLKKMSLDSLVEGLDYLANSRIEPQRLKGVKAKFIHGEEDTIAPIGEIVELKKEVPQIEFIVIEKCGHMPFLNPNFKKALK